MALELNGWQRIGVVVSAVWASYILGLAAYDYLKPETFAEELSGFCPSLTHRHFVEWQDAKTGSRIATFQEGERSVSCEIVGRRAAALLAQASGSSIQPTKSVAYGGLAGALLIPVVAMWISAYVLVYLIGWVRSGFTKSEHGI